MYMNKKCKTFKGIGVFKNVFGSFTNVVEVITIMITILEIY
jgi:hypothetical protein